MIPSAGSTCRFTFTARFSTLDGIYKTRAVVTFNDSIASGVDYVSGLYTPAGLSQADFNADYADYLGDKVVVLESIVDPDIVYYVPETVFLTIPDPTIREYYPLVMVVNLGVQRDTQKVLPVIENVKDLIRTTLGTTDPVRLVTSEQNKIYLTDAEYEALEVAREVNIEALSPLSVQLKQLQDINQILIAKVAAYEALLVQLGGTPTPTP
jgi:hypothetical protein